MVNTQVWMDAQYSVLGSVLIDARCAPEVMHSTTEADFTGPCLTVYKAIRQLFTQGVEIDPVTVLDKVGSQYRDFVLQLMETTPTAANVSRYIGICRERSKIHRIKDLWAQMEEEEDADEIRSLVEQASAVLVDRTSVKVTTMEAALRSFMDRHSREDVEYLKWPIQQLNKQIFSELGDFIVIGGEPSTGKSSFALQCAWHFAGRYKVGFFSLETTDDKLFDRRMAGVMQLDMSKLKQNSLSQSDWDRVCSRTQEVLDRRLEIVNAAGYTALDVRAMTMARGYDIIFVDYLQLLSGPGRDRPAIVTGNSIALHTMAQSMGVTVVALSQLTYDSDRGGPPTLDSLRESRQIGQDADVVMMLSLTDKNNRSGTRELHVQKNKEGTLGHITLSFNGQRQTFSSVVDSGKGEELPPQQMSMLPQDTYVPF